MTNQTEAADTLPKDEWLEAGKLVIGRHAKIHGYPSPEIHEDVTVSGKRRLWWLDGNGNKLQYTLD